MAFTCTDYVTMWNPYTRSVTHVHNNWIHQYLAFLMFLDLCRIMDIKLPLGNTVTPTEYSLLVVLTRNLVYKYNCLYRLLSCVPDTQD